MVNDRHLQMAQSSGLSSTKHRVETDLEDKIALNLSTYCTGGSIREGPSLRLSLTLSKLIFLLQKKNDERVYEARCDDIMEHYPGINI